MDAFMGGFTNSEAHEPFKSDLTLPVPPEPTK
jgi:hypothetical protein